MLPNHPVVDAHGSDLLKYALVAESAMDGTSAPASLISEPPKKLPTPIPNVVIARPVTF
jgi:hypothetical protein